MTGRPLTIVTGGTRGIGAAIATRLAAAGHDLVLGYRSDAGTARRLVDSLGGTTDVEIVAADLGEFEGFDVLFAAAKGRPVTGFVNNAGVTAHIGDLAETPVDVIRRVIDLNLTSAVIGCRRAVQVMSTRLGGRGGVIVNISSGAAVSGSPHEYVHYAAAKAGVEALTIGLAREVAAEGIRVNAVAPGMIETRIHADAGDPDRLERLASRIPIGRPGQPGEVAAAVAWLLGDEASYATGAVLRIAGGL